MQMVVTAKQMSEMDRTTIENVGIPGVVLMENAGRGITEVAQSILGTVEGKSVYIFSGPGNNGGDGFVVARHLANRGARVNVYLVGKKEKVKGDALTNLNILQSMEHEVIEIQKLEHIPNLSAADLIIDALLGTGVQGPLRGLFADVVARINESGAPTMAVDIPTGVNTDTGAVDGPCCCATATATMALHKRGLVLPPGREHAGDLHVIDISMPEAVSNKLDAKTYMVGEQDIRNMLPRRKKDAYKNVCGTVLVVAGSIGYTGAACLSSEAVLRSGAGLCYLSTTQSLNTIFEQQLAEVITFPVQDSGLCLSISNFEEILNKAKNQNVIAVGPGLGTNGATVQLVHRLLEALDKPLVIDADGINALAGSTELIANYRNELVLTPHPGELSRLIGKSTREILNDRIEIARATAESWQKVLVLKGSPTIIADETGRVYINPTGNAGMATGGSGDVLTGVIAGLLAQGLSAVHAAIAGVYVHGLAGDIAKEYYGEFGMIAGDILECVPQAFLNIQTKADNET